MLLAPINAEVKSDQSHTDSIDLHNSCKLHCLSVVSQTQRAIEESKPVGPRVSLKVRCRTNYSRRADLDELPQRTVPESWPGLQRGRECEKGATNMKFVAPSQSSC